MNRRGFVATLAGLAGALGLRGQQPTTGTITNSEWSGPYSDGEGGCYMTNGTLLGLKRVPCKEGEEYCPLGHSQKSRYFVTNGTMDHRPKHGNEVNAIDPPGGWDHTEFKVFWLRVCSVCGVVYVLPEKKP